MFFTSLSYYSYAYATLFLPVPVFFTAHPIRGMVVVELLWIFFNFQLPPTECSMERFCILKDDLRQWPAFPFHSLSPPLKPMVFTASRVQTKPSRPLWYTLSSHKNQRVFFPSTYSSKGMQIIFNSRASFPLQLLFPFQNSSHVSFPLRHYYYYLPPSVPATLWKSSPNSHI